MAVRRRQSIPAQWLVVPAGSAIEAAEAARRLRPGSGVLLLEGVTEAELRRFRTIARRRQLLVVSEGPLTAVRVHNSKELRQALLRRTPLVLLSPVNRTSTHPDWKELPRMRAASLARLGGRRLIALGGMDSKRYSKVARLGFIGWAGISAFRT